MEDVSLGERKSVREKEDRKIYQKQNRGEQKRKMLNGPRHEQSKQKSLSRRPRRPRREKNYRGGGGGGGGGGGKKPIKKKKKKGGKKKKLVGTSVRSPEAIPKSHLQGECRLLGWRREGKQGP